MFLNTLSDGEYIYLYKSIDFKDGEKLHLLFFKLMYEEKKKIKNQDRTCQNKPEIC